MGDVAPFRDFQWDEVKRASNRLKHGVDFEDAMLALSGRRLEHMSLRNGEERFLAICEAANRVLAVVYTMRGASCRIISDGLRVPMNEKTTTCMTLDELQEKRARGEKSLSDWDRIDAMSVAERAAAADSDPDFSEFKNVDLSKAVWVEPVAKLAVSIRLDEDVVAFFKKDGPGYQSRINAVLRHYMHNVPKAAE